MSWFKSLFKRKQPEQPVAQPKPRTAGQNLMRALNHAEAGAAPEKTYKYPIQAPHLIPGILPPDVEKAPIAMDASPAVAGCYDYARQGFGAGEFYGFPGYPYLSMLSTRAEYRAFAQALSSEMTREWIVLNSTETAGDETKNRIKELNLKIKELKIQDLIRTAVEHDAFFGRAQILIKVGKQDLKDPLIVDKKTVPKGANLEFKCVEAIWTTPLAWNAINPAASDFYVPSQWSMMGQRVHASRFLTIITRPVADMLKPAFNFGGMSLSQLAEPYVDNWLRTRKSVGDLISNFSIIMLKTHMDQVLQGGEGTEDAVDSLMMRAKLFSAHRDNQGVFLADKDSEEMEQIAVPLSSLDQLQAQAQEHMCSVSKIPAIILTGIEPAGLNVSSEGTIKVFNNWISAQQNAFYLHPVEIIVSLIQLSLFGEIDEDIVISFQPLFQMTPKELAEIRTADATTDANMIDRQVISPLEVRERLARNPESGYQGLDLNFEPQQMEQEDVP